MSTLRRLALQAAIATTYAVAGALGLGLAFAHPSASPVWAPAGIALAAGLRFGSLTWPAVFVGAFAVNLATYGTVLTSLGIGLGNTLEAVIGTLLIERWARGARAFERARSSFLFVMLAAGVGTIAAASVGVATLDAAGLVPDGATLTIWLTWWLGDAVGALVVAPFLLLWGDRERPRLEPGALLEALTLTVALVGTAGLVFAEASPFARLGAPIEFLLMPLLMWAAYRFGPREAITAVLLVAVIAIVGTVDERGPFAVGSRNTSLLLLQAFIGTAAATGLIVAAAMNQRRHAEAQLREWSITDPLTGLGNYRLLAAAIDRESQRSRRTGRRFAILLLDLDHLKKINDAMGHLVGSRALRRIGEVLRRTCRAVDTATRYGGDEFAVVLPESEEAEATLFAKRVSARLTEDTEDPPLTVSIGVAVFGRDGDSMDAMLRAADERMYSDKRARAARPRTPVNG